MCIRDRLITGSSEVAFDVVVRGLTMAMAEANAGSGGFLAEVVAEVLDVEVSAVHIDVEDAAVEEDVASLCLVDETQEECDARRRDAGWAPLETGGLLRVVERCNYYDAARYAPVLCGGEPVGAVSGELLRKLKGLGLSNAVEVGPNPLPYTASLDGDVDVASKAVVLAPNADSVGDRTRVVAALVEALVADSELLAERGGSEAIAFVPRAKLRGELQDVRPSGRGLAAAPLLRMERAAVVAFGVVSYGCHVSGYVAGDDGRPAAVWVATRALSKPTYAGLYDQIAAGGLPAELTLLENAKKEAEEEAVSYTHLTLPTKA